MKFLFLLMLLTSEIFAQELYCFVKLASAQNSAQSILRYYEAMEFTKRRYGLKYAEPKIEFKSDRPDRFGRGHCFLVTEKKLSPEEISVIAKHQIAEDQEIAHLSRVTTIKDPWGGEPIEVDGKPRVYQSCKTDLSECDDLVITALRGEDNVIEYRFWLDRNSNEPMTVYKAASNALELSKVMKALKKDKTNTSYSFSPKGKASSTFLPDVKLGGVSN